MLSVIGSVLKPVAISAPLVSCTFAQLLQLLLIMLLRSLAERSLTVSHTCDAP